MQQKFFFSAIGALFFTITASLQIIANEVPPFQIIEDTATTPRVTAAFADRKISKIQLQNGLKAYLISDPQAEKSAVALSVHAGSWEDPTEHPGLAHFLEHMLFLGTEKYPEDSAYDSFIKEHGGMSNAFTENLYTTFGLEINHSGFREGLDRFSRFFKEPTLNPSGVMREMQVIAQEYSELASKDAVRRYFVMKELGNPAHPQYRFSIGNGETLAGVSTAYLRNWFETNYSANQMHLVVYSSLPLETLQQYVAEDFSDIPTHNKVPFQSKEPIFLSKESPEIAYIVPIQNMRTVTLTWELPENFVNQERKRPDDLLCYVLGHEGSHSLLTFLKNKNWAENIACGIDKHSPEKAFLYLQIDLTRQGLAKLYDVIAVCFQALATFKQNEFPEYLFSDIQTIAKIRYQYASRQEAFQEVIAHTSRLHFEDLSSYPENTAIVQEFDPQLIAELLATLTPETCQIDVMAPENESKVAADREEKWLHVPYGVKAIPSKKWEEWKASTPISELALPRQNPFIPKALTLIINEKETPLTSLEYPSPQTLVDDEKGRLYFAMDQYYLLPEISWRIKIKTPKIDAADAQSIVLGDLYIKALREELNAVAYEAAMTGLHYSIQRTTDDIVLSIDGFSENAPLLFEEILSHLKTVSIPAEKFKIYKECLLRQYQNFSHEQPWMRGLELINSLVNFHYAKQEQKAKAIRQITPELFQSFVQELYSQAYLEGLFYGNMTKKQALNIWKLLTDTLDFAVYPNANRKLPKIASLPIDSGPYYVERKVKGHGNAVVLLLQNPNFSFKTQAAQSILSQMLNEPLFTELRTKQQTGYFVHQSIQEVERKLFSFYVVQSHTHDPRDLLARIELFFEGFLQELQHDPLAEKSFNNIREALIASYMQFPKQMNGMADDLKEYAFNYEGDFNWNAKSARGLEELTYEEFLAFARKTLGKKNKQRLALLIKGMIPENNQFFYSKAKSADWLRNLSNYSTRE